MTKNITLRALCAAQDAALQAVSIKRVMFLLLIQFVKACSVLADLSAVDSLPQRTTLLTATQSKPRLTLYFHILVSGQLQLRTLSSRPEGVRLRELRLYFNILLESNTVLHSADQKTVKKEPNVKIVLPLFPRKSAERSVQLRSPLNNLSQENLNSEYCSEQYKQ